VRHGSTTFGAAGCLKALDVSCGEAPIQTIRDFLMGRYESRFEVHPRVLEEVVASVYKDLGYQAVVTNYSGDGGIDVFLRQGDETVGVQVKRYKHAIGVSQIRELAGAMLYHDVAKGIFVTTSRFERGAAPTATVFAMRGMPIELVDADRFYAALEIAQAEHYAEDAAALIARSREHSMVLHNESNRALP
jgi:restriction system protein